MRKRKNKIGVILGLAVLIAGTLAGCGDSQKTSAKGLSGTITLSGSTSMEKLANALSESFMERHSSGLRAAGNPHF